MYFDVRAYGCGSLFKSTDTAATFIGVIGVIVIIINVYDDVMDL